MSLNGLVNSGRTQCGFLEKTADAILAFPKAMWFGKKVTIEKVGNEYISKSEKNKNFTGELPAAMNGVSGIYPLSGLFQLMIGAVYVSACMAAAPFLGLGLALKKLALKTDKAAGIYNKAVEDELQKEKIKSEIASLNNRQIRVDAKIQELQPLEEMVAKQPNLKKYLTIKPDSDLIWYKKKKQEIPQRISGLETKLKKVQSHFEKTLKRLEAIH